MSIKDANSFYPSNKSEWRSWLEENHISEDSIWIIMYKKNTGVPTITWSEAVDEALCFGWIDSVRRSIDEEKFTQYFSKRKAKSIWSKINKDKVVHLKKENLMFKAGLDSIKIAKQNGSWTFLDPVDQMIIPKDLEDAFQASPNSKEYYMSLSNSVRKQFLYWILSAKRAETREKRIREIVDNASENLKPKQFR